MQIYLAKPGGQRLGPFSLEQINRDLATSKYKDSDFWAWHEGLPSWVPLYSIKGVTAAVAAPAAAAPALAPAKPQVPSVQASSASPIQPAKPQPSAFQSASAPIIQQQPPKPQQTPVVQANPPIVVRPAPAKPQAPTHPPGSSAAPPQPAKPQFSGFQSAPAPAARPQPPQPQAPASQPAFASAPQAAKPPAPSIQSAPFTAAKPPPAKPQAPAVPRIPSGFPFPALEQVFIFTTADADSVFQSQTTVEVLQAAAGRPLDAIQQKVPIDIISNSDVAVQMMRGGSIPDEAWQAMSALKPVAAEQAQDGALDLYLHPFPIESSQVVALFLLYNKQRAKPS